MNISSYLFFLSVLYFSLSIFVGGGDIEAEELGLGVEEVGRECGREGFGVAGDDQIGRAHV